MPNTVTKKGAARTNRTSGSNTGSRSTASRRSGATTGGNGPLLSANKHLMKTGPLSRKSDAKSRRSTQKGTVSQDSNSLLEKFFQDQLKELYRAEKRLTLALPKMRKAATTEDLKAALEEHTIQTREHVTRLEQVFQMMGKQPKTKKCDALDSLVKEGENLVGNTPPGSITRDVGIIMAAQKIEHYEIASYGALVQLAETMGESGIAGILSQTLMEEKQTEEDLSSLAENNINWEADAAEDEGDSGDETA